LKKTPGVIAASVSFEKGEAFIRYDDQKITIAELRRVINSTGFKAVEGKGGRKAPAKRGKRKTS
jgi:mercuric ion transport protein